MAKQSGIGDRLFISGYDVSGDIGSLSNIHGGMATQDVTDITQAGHARIGLVRDGGFSFASFMNDDTDMSFERLSALPRTDLVATYGRGTSIGSPAASVVCKQIDYNPTRGSDGSLTWSTEVQANAFGLEWGEQLTGGIRTDTSATSPVTGLDTAASADFGLQAYLHVFSFTGTSVTVTLEDSPDNSSFSAIGSGLSFAAASGVGAQRLESDNTETIERYVRVITTGTFSECSFMVQLTKNTVAGQAF